MPWSARGDGHAVLALAPTRIHCALTGDRSQSPEPLPTAGCVAVIWMRNLVRHRRSPDLMTQPINPVWWLGLVTGILEVALGFGASQQYITARATLLILWVGFFAIFRGISHLVVAFHARSAG